MANLYNEYDGNLKKLKEELYEGINEYGKELLKEEKYTLKDFERIVTDGEFRQLWLDISYKMRELYLNAFRKKYETILKGDYTFESNLILDALKKFVSEMVQSNSSAIDEIGDTSLSDDNVTQKNKCPKDNIAQLGEYAKFMFQKMHELNSEYLCLNRHRASVVFKDLDFGKLSEQTFQLFLKVDEYIENNDVNILSIEGMEKVLMYEYELLGVQSAEVEATIHLANEIYFQQKQQELISQLYPLVLETQLSLKDIEANNKEKLYEAIENICDKYNIMFKIKLQLYMFVERKLYTPVVGSEYKQFKKHKIGDDHNEKDSGSINIEVKTEAMKKVYEDYCKLHT